MRLTRESRYAIEALVVLADVPLGEMMEAREIAELADLPAPFLSKILRLLALGGVVRSRRGKGYALARTPDEIALADVLRAVEGGDVICPLHFRWSELKPGIQDSMGAVTLADIAQHGFAADARAGQHPDGR
jgi:DNA-binding IscR family transcriptional regulator